MTKKERGYGDEGPSTLGENLQLAGAAILALGSTLVVLAAPVTVPVLLKRRRYVGATVLTAAWALAAWQVRKMELD